MPNVFDIRRAMAGHDADAFLAGMRFLLDSMDDLMAFGDCDHCDGQELDLDLAESLVRDCRCAAQTASTAAVASREVA